jgi:hypothetical protein
MIIEDIKYHIICDRCKVNGIDTHVDMWTPSHLLDRHTTYSKYSAYKDKEKLVIDFTSYGWKISEEETICPKCLCREKTKLDLTTIRGKNIIDDINKFIKNGDADESHSLQSCTYEDEKLSKKQLRIDFLVDDRDAIYKHNDITIYEDGEVTVSLCERYEGGGIETELETFIAKLLIK